MHPDDSGTSGRPSAPRDPDWEGKYPVVGLRVASRPSPPEPGLVEALASFRVPDLSDRLGILYTVDAAIRPAYASMAKMAGAALTVRIPPGDNMMVLKALDLAQPGDVLVIDARGRTDWCCGGGNVCRMAQERGVRGFVVDGAYRDILEVEEMGFPLYLRGVTPATGPKRGPGEINVAAHCGGVVVHPGDIVVGDSEGIAVVPLQFAGDVLRALRERSAAAGSGYPWREVMAYYDEVLAARGCRGD